MAAEVMRLLLAHSARDTSPGVHIAFTPELVERTSTAR
jgi:DNA-binding LacI/PurR family transcriptional regulator